MESYKNITTYSLLALFIIGCGSVKQKDPYRPSGKSVQKIIEEKKVINRKTKVHFLRDRYNLCTHKRALRSARYKYGLLINREKRYGNKLTKEKNKYKKIILDVGSQTNKEEREFQKKYRRRLYCTPEEMRHLNL